MTVHINGSKGKELYYNGVKIKEAYYNGNKVYSSFTPQTIRFDYTGSVQTFTIPYGCTKINVDCVGASGGSDPFGFRSGLGGRVQATINVQQNQILYLYVGERGKNSPTSYSARSGSAFNGGGEASRGTTGQNLGARCYAAGGGGASDIRIGGTNLSDRVIVAGAGGGGMINEQQKIPRTGGNGGGLIGGNGSYTDGQYGIGGSQTAGGSQGGSLGYGGSFYTGSNSCAGGGGGYYGGGYGRGQMTIVGGGGGGSSYTDPNLCSNVVHTQGYSEATGNGWIIISTLKE